MASQGRFRGQAFPGHCFLLSRLPESLVSLILGGITRDWELVALAYPPGRMEELLGITWSCLELLGTTSDY